MAGKTSTGGENNCRSDSAQNLVTLDLAGMAAAGRGALEDRGVDACSVPAIYAT